MKETHETQAKDEFQNLEGDKIYTPIEDLQKITTGGAFKRNNLKLGSLPKGIRYIGYFIIGFSALTILLGLVFSLFFK